MCRTCEKRPARIKRGQNWAKKGRKGVANGVEKNVLKPCEKRPTRVNRGQSWTKNGRKGVADGVAKRYQNL